MGYPTRIYYSQEQKILVWDRWQAGDSTYEPLKRPLSGYHGVLLLTRSHCRLITNNRHALNTVFCKHWDSKQVVGSRHRGTTSNE